MLAGWKLELVAAGNTEGATVGVAELVAAVPPRDLPRLARAASRLARERANCSEVSDEEGSCGACGVGICSPEEALGVGTASVGSTAGGIVGCCIGGSRTDEIEEDRGAAGGVGSGALE